MDRRMFLSTAGLLAASQLAPSSAQASGTNTANTSGQNPRVLRIDHLPAIMVEPPEQASPRQLVIWLDHFGGRKEDTLPMLNHLASKGFVTLSFDTWQHGERGVEPPEQLGSRVFSQFRKGMWPIIGQSVLDTSKVIDWAQANLNIKPKVFIGGYSMGGDIAVAAAGFDPRIQRVAATVATPDWTRPGMRLGQDIVDQGEADRYANFFYRQLNPLTNVQAYAHAPAITFECGADDQHVPPDGALNFQRALQSQFGKAKTAVRVNLHPGVGHQSTHQTLTEHCVDWFLAGQQ